MNIYIEFDYHFANWLMHYLGWIPAVRNTCKRQFYIWSAKRKGKIAFRTYKKKGTKYTESMAFPIDIRIVLY